MDRVSLILVGMAAVLILTAVSIHQKGSSKDSETAGAFRGYGSRFGHRDRSADWTPLRSLSVLIIVLGVLYGIGLDRAVAGAAEVDGDIVKWSKRLYTWFGGIVTGPSANLKFHCQTTREYRCS